MNTAIVLSGGGAHGDFEVGALRYLYNRGFYPKIICGSSVGAINGVKLAEGGDYQADGITCYVYDKPTGVNDAELFRLLNPNTGDHFYTISRTELQNALDNLGYIYEGVTCYVLASQTTGTIPFYQLHKVYEPPVDVDLVQGVMASASIPVVFPPVKLLDEWYIDGGVRDILPIQAAIDLGADKVFGIVATKATIPDSKPYDDADIQRIGIRSVDIMTDEIQRNEFNPPRGWGIPVTVIQPTDDVHDTMTIIPAKILISMAYGFMRAADMIDVPQNNRRRCMELADIIIKLREQIIAVETYARTSNVLFDKQAQDELLQTRSMKRQLKALIDERRNLSSADSVPADVQTWWQQWERRSDPPFIATPWDAVVDDTGRVLIEAEPSP
jgi:predicted patatin/cPLA2 family phospholipase